MEDASRGCATVGPMARPKHVSQLSCGSFFRVQNGLDFGAASRNFRPVMRNSSSF
jgi:hypothetical protein